MTIFVVVASAIFATIFIATFVSEHKKMVERRRKRLCAMMPPSLLEQLRRGRTGDGVPTERELIDVVARANGLTRAEARNAF